MNHNMQEAIRPIIPAPHQHLTHLYEKEKFKKKNFFLSFWGEVGKGSSCVRNAHQTQTTP